MTDILESDLSGQSIALVLTTKSTTTKRKPIKSLNFKVHSLIDHRFPIIVPQDNRQSKRTNVGHEVILITMLFD